MTNSTRKEPALPSGADLQAQAQAFLRDAAIWMQQHWLNILVATAIAVAIFFALHATRRWGMRVCERGAGVANWYSIIGRAVSKTGHFFILMTSIRLVAGYANPPVMVMATIGFLFTIAAVFQAAIWVRELIFGAVEHKTSSEQYHGAGLASALGIIRMIVTVVVFAIAFVVVLSNLGVDVTGLVAGLGVGGIAIGLAAQGIFADLFAALAIIFDKPFRVGDKVRFDTTSGVIQSIGLKSTRVRAFTGEELIIANKQLLDKVIENISNRHHVRIKLLIGVAYETPHDKLEALPAILTEVVGQCEAKISRASFEAFGASSIDMILEFDVPGDDQPAAHAMRDKVIIGIVRRFAEEGVSIPYPTQTAFTAMPDGTLVPPYPMDGDEAVCSASP
ncbi:mechanosensitive ion channel family protein [Sphingomonas sp.]|jgi:small-conductance mechanosensitive channel|uniref:mechanosensitive ion channel family protein n=1 Tax=Sphingomonas sp. TaxID=28214 RepID=UPI002EDA1E1C